MIGNGGLANNSFITNTGPITEPTITDHGNGLISVGSCMVRLCPNPDFTGAVDTYTIAPLNNYQLTAETYSYVIVDYNNGVPIYKVITDNNLINHSNILNIAQFYWEDGAINETHYFVTGTYGLGLSNKISHRLIHTERFGYESGLGLSELGTRNVRIEAGRLWYDGTEISVDTVDTSLTEEIHFYYHASSVWQVSKVTTYNNTQYDNGNNLATLSAGKYALNWIYRSVSPNDKACYIVLGTGNYNLAEVQEAQPPALPSVIMKQCILVGRIIVKKSENTATQIDSAFEITFQPSLIVNHNDLSNRDEAGSHSIFIPLADSVASFEFRKADGLTSILDIDTYNGKLVGLITKAETLKANNTTGVISILGPTAGTNRVKTVRDADDTILELGGSYTPSGTWNWTSAIASWPTFNQDTTGNASTVTVNNEGVDTTCFPLFAITQSGSITPKTNSNFTYNSSTGLLSSTLFSANTITANTAFVPDTDGGADLGTTILGFQNLHLNTGATISFENGNVLLTHSNSVLTLTTGTLALGSNSLTMTGSIGATGARVTKGWFADLEVTNAIAGSITGNAATVSVIAETSDATCFPLFTNSASGSLGPKTNSNLKYNASTGLLEALSFSNSTITLASTGILQMNGSGASVNGTIQYASLIAIGINAGLAFDGSNEVAYLAGKGNIAIGNDALKSAITTHENIAIGEQALCLLSVVGGSGDTSNVGIGVLAGRNMTTGQQNVFLGSGAGTNITSGDFNTFLGSVAGYGDVAGAGTVSYNVGIGFQVLQNIKTGSTSASSRTVAIGFNTFKGSTADGYTGHRNTGVGSHVGLRISSGERNTLLGAYAGTISPSVAEPNYTITTGSGNIFLGAGAGAGIFTGSNNTIIGNNLVATTFATRTILSDISNNIILADGDGNIGLAATSTTLQLGNANTATTILYGNLGLGITPFTKLTVPGNIPKTEATLNNLAFFGTNEVASSNPFGLALGIKGGSTANQRFFYIDTAEYGSTYSSHLMIQTGSASGSDATVSIGVDPVYPTPLSKFDVHRTVSTNDYGVAVIDNLYNNYDTNPTVTLPVLTVRRVGKPGYTYDSMMQIGISRWENVPYEGRTQVDFKLIHGLTGLPDMTALSLKSNGDVIVTKLLSTDMTVTNPISGSLASFATIKDHTGFTNTSGITVSYSDVTKKITLTGTFSALWQGVTISALVSGWTSPALTDTYASPNTLYYLYYNGSSFVWSSTAWTFDMLQIATVLYNGAGTFQFAMKETHGFQSWETHEELHKTVGTYLEPINGGGDLSNYTLNSTTAAQRRPDTSQATIYDEDNKCILSGKTDKLYTIGYLTSSGIGNINVVTDQNDFTLLSGNQPYYNLYTGGVWTQALLAANDYTTYWKVAIPVTNDTVSQKYRFVWIQGQSSGTLSSQQALTPANVSIGNLANLSTEFVFIGKVIIRYTAANWVLIQVDKIVGSKATQIISNPGLTGVTTDASLSGIGTPASPLSVVGVTGFTAGSIPFIGATANFVQDNASLFFDDTNNRLGVGTTSPEYLLHIKGTSVTNDKQPVTLFVDDAQTSATWLPWTKNARLAFGSDDTTGINGIRASISSFMDDAAGTASGLSFAVTTSSTVITDVLSLTPRKSLLLNTKTENLQGSGGTTNPLIAFNAEKISLYNGASLGSELILNGTFVDTSNWTAYTGSTFSVASNKATLVESSATPTSSYLRQSTSGLVTSGKWYRVSVAFYGTLSSNLLDAYIAVGQLSLDGTPSYKLVNAESLLTDNTITLDFMAGSPTATYLYLVHTSTNALVGTSVWGTVSFKELTTKSRLDLTHTIIDGEQGSFIQNGPLGIALGTSAGTAPVSTLEARSTTGAIATLTRVDTSVTADDSVGKLQFYAKDTSTTTNFIVADIEAQSTKTITTDINPGRLILRTTASGVAATPTARLVIEDDGRIYATGIHNNSGAVTGTTNQYFASGTYTPSLSNMSGFSVNPTTSTGFNWIRVGNVVSVSGQLSGHTTNANLSLVSMSLPIASNFANSYELTGNATTFNTNMINGAVYADAGNDVARLDIRSSSSGWGDPLCVSFQYTIL
jgi:hypothetical protein